MTPSMHGFTASSSEVDDEHDLLVVVIDSPGSARKHWTYCIGDQIGATMAHTGQTLENPASGERITFRQTSANTRGELLAIDLELPANRRVPGGQHIHPKQEERFQVVEGTMRFRMGRGRRGPRRGGRRPPGQKHDFANVGDDDALVRVEACLH